MAVEEKGRRIRLVSFFPPHCQILGKQCHTVHTLCPLLPLTRGNKFSYLSGNESTTTTTTHQPLAPPFACVLYVCVCSACGNVRLAREERISTISRIRGRGRGGGGRNSLDIASFALISPLLLHSLHSLVPTHAPLSPFPPFPPCESTGLHQYQTERRRRKPSMYVRVYRIHPPTLYSSIGSHATPLPPSPNVNNSHYRSRPPRKTNVKRSP